MSKSGGTVYPNGVVPVLLTFGGGDSGDSQTKQEQSTEVNVSPKVVFEDTYLIPENNRKAAQNRSSLDPSQIEEPIFHILPMDPREDRPPVDNQAKKNQRIHVRQDEARFQIEVYWPPDLDPCWVFIETPSEFRVSFLHQHENCEYKEYNAGESKFKLCKLAFNVSFTISITCPDKEVNHWILFKSESEDNLEKIRLVEP